MGVWRFSHIFADLSTILTQKRLSGSLSRFAFAAPGAENGDAGRGESFLRSPEAQTRWAHLEKGRTPSALAKKLPLLWAKMFIIDFFKIYFIHFFFVYKIFLSIEKIPFEKYINVISVIDFRDGTAYYRQGKKKHYFYFTLFWIELFHFGRTGYHSESEKHSLDDSSCSSRKTALHFAIFARQVTVSSWKFHASPFQVRRVL